MNNEFDWSDYGVIDEDCDGDVDLLDVLEDSTYEDLSNDNQRKSYLDDEDDDNEDDYKEDYEEDDDYELDDDVELNDFNDEPEDDFDNEYQDYDKTTSTTNTITIGQIKFSMEDDDYSNIANNLTKQLFKKYPKLDIVWKAEDDCFSDIIEEEFQYNKLESLEYIDYFINLLEPKDINSMKYCDNIFFDFILQPILRIIDLLSEKDNDFLEYMETKNWLEKILQDYKWPTQKYFYPFNYLEDFMDYFEKIDRIDLSIKTYTLFFKHQGQNYTHKDFGRFWKDKEFEYAINNPKLLEFYFAKMQELGEFGLRPTEKLKKYIKENK